jgi:DNA-binding NarL/FixJ family response regulator
MRATEVVLSSQPDGADTERQPRRSPQQRRVTIRSTHATGPAHVPPIEPVIRVGILLVDDRALLASSLAVVLDLDPELDVVAVESDPADASRMLAARPAIVLADSVRLAAEMKAGRPDVRLIVLGPSSDGELILACIRAGAAACVDTDISPAALIATIKRVHAGELLFEAGPLVQLLVNAPMPVPSAPQRTARLAERELQVLAAIATGMSSAEAADHLGISLATLRTHLKNIVTKLEARSKLDAVLIAIREGRIRLN